MTDKDPKDLHVLIVGAGTTGLLIAQGLKKSSIRFTLFESETPSTYLTRPREWGMTLHWGSSHIQSCLPPHLASRFHEAYADPTQSPGATTGLPVYNGKTGELIMEIGAEKPCRVSRKKMRNLFAEGIDVQYGKEVRSAEVGMNGSVKVEFSDGTSATGDVLVGCDGAKSRIRTSICGPTQAALTEVPISMFNFPYKLDAGLAKRIRDMNELFITSIHPDHGMMFWLSIQDVPTSDPSTWTFQVLQSWHDSTVPASFDLTTPPGRMSFFKHRAEEWAEPWRSAGRAIAADTHLPLDKSTYWANCAEWDNRAGRMTLAGDAAHPMTPHRGQGLNNALQDAANFVAAVERVGKGEVG
ncbi:hypothetical protein BKA63DRAFT_92978 [Paraphoma chrysanthemicola]|nr:hypothetical protein BKA63DRAFT_92978 [Paraphoma chrysanthemicola]